MFWRTLFALLICWVFIDQAESQSVNCSSVACRTVVNSVDALRGGTFSTAPYAQITVTCYHTNTADVICAGGGDFDRILYSSSDPNCFQTVGLDNGATLIQDHGGNCFYRKNFGLNGIVDARQCGVYGDGLTHTPLGDGDLLQACLNVAANQATLKNPTGLLVVNTGGGVILDNTTSIEVPANVELTCGGGNLSDVGNSDYRIFKSGNLQLSNAIVMNPATSGGGPFTILLDKRNSTLSGCNIEAGAGPTGANQFSPSIWYPNCDPGNPSSCSDGSTTYLRSAIDEQMAFSAGGPAAGSVGISIQADHATIRNVTVLGFGTCYSLSNGSNTESRPVIDHLIGDCNTGISIVNSNNPHIDSFILHPFLTSGSNSSLVKDITAIVPDSGSGEYQVTAHVDTGAGAYQFANGDTVWIATPGNGGGRESARGRWTIGSTSSPTVCSGGSCQSFLLVGSTTAATSLSGDVTNAIPTSGYLPTTISNISPASLKFVAPGQGVSDPGHGCIQGGTTVTAVWPARGMVFLSAPAICTQTSDTVVFTDNAYASAGACSDDPQNGCVTVDSAFRFGEGFHAENVGGISAVNCNVFEHQIAYHLTTGANGGRWANCAAGDNINLPQRNIQDLSNSIITLLIDGKHGTYNPEDASDNDACDNNWVNSVLGQHRPAAIVVQSNCPDANKFANIGVGIDNSQRSGIALEVDAGAVLMSNAYGGGPGSVFKADQSYLYNSSGGQTGPYEASLNISSNLLSAMTLYSSNGAAGNTMVGCGNRFLVTTPYLCAPSSFVQPPGGRLTLCATPPCPPVMTGDVVAATQVYYVPYTGQQVPLYSATNGAFGLIDIGGAGLTLNLDNTGSDKQAANTLYDLFVDNLHGSQPVLCSLAWATSGAGSSTRATQLAQINGIWVNATDVPSCQYAVNLNDKCPAFQCTYVGTMYMTGDGQTTQQFKPAAASGGSLNCVCLYNAYNRVTITSESFDLEGQYTYPTNTWRPMGNTMGARNTITVVDGLGQMYVSAQLNDLMFKTPSTGGTGAIGIDLNSTTLAPALVAQVATTTQASYQTILTNPPVKGLWYVQAMEKAVSGLSVTFGGATFQELSVQVQD